MNCQSVTKIKMQMKTTHTHTNTANYMTAIFVHRVVVVSVSVIVS